MLEHNNAYCSSDSNGESEGDESEAEDVDGLVDDDGFFAMDLMVGERDVGDCEECSANERGEDCEG